MVTVSRFALIIGVWERLDKERFQAGHNVGAVGNQLLGPVVVLNGRADLSRTCRETVVVVIVVVVRTCTSRSRRPLAE
jgi:hypothetical protein